MQWRLSQLQAVSQSVGGAKLAEGLTGQAKFTSILHRHQDVVKRGEDHAVIEMIRQGKVQDRGMKFALVERSQMC